MFNYSLCFSNGVLLSSLVTTVFNIYLHFFSCLPTSSIISFFFTIFVFNCFIFCFMFSCFYSGPYFPSWHLCSPLTLFSRMLLGSQNIFLFIDTNNWSIERAIQACQFQAGLGRHIFWHILGTQSVSFQWLPGWIKIEMAYSSPYIFGTILSKIVN